MPNPKLKPLSEQVIVITGASSGIGLVTARAAAERGAKVMLIARDEAALADIVAGITAAGGTAAYAVADVGDASAVEAAALKTIARFARIDTWVNNAGVAIYAKLLETSNDDHERLFRTNYFGAVHGARAAIPHLRRQGGALITVGSIASQMPAPIMGAYAASKHATKAYVDALRIELNADDVPVAVTLVMPSGIDTPIAENAVDQLDGEALIPPPVYDPKLVADAILDAAEHPRREVTVGGVGRLQVLAAAHFPRMLDYLGALIAPMLRDPKLRKTSGDNLAAPLVDGRERSREQQGRSFSLYTTAGRHRGLMLLAAGAGVAAVAGVSALRRRSTNEESASSRT